MSSKSSEDTSVMSSRVHCPLLHVQDQKWVYNCRSGIKGGSVDLHQLKAFEAVAMELHFRRAAERLRVAQPYLSRTIKALENDLGTPLFRRTTRQVELTAAGRAFLEPVRRMLAMEEEARGAALAADQ